jgi:hypothetical protein
MPAELPICQGEYLWSQSDPVYAMLIAVFHLPHRISVAASIGQDTRRQSLTLSLAQSATGMNHLTLSGLEHHGHAEEPAATRDLFYLLMNTTVALLQHHCPRQLSLGGQVPCTLLPGPRSIALAWELWGFQLLAAASPGSRRVLARVRTLRIETSPSCTDLMPLALRQAELQWTPA